jgi:hypothetical protein
MRIFFLSILTLPSFAAMLHSNPLAFNKLYLDTETVPWIVSDSTLNEVFREVSNVYAHFNVDVTNEDPGPRDHVAWIVIGGHVLPDGTAGMSGIGNWVPGTTYKPFGLAFASLVYPDGLEIPDIAEAIAHEAGHGFGLGHDTDIDDVMYPTLLGRVNQFNVVNTEFLDNLLGVYAPPDVAPDSPEPPVLLAMLGMLMRRGRI